MGPRHDLVIIGMGSAGLAAAELALRLGLRVGAVERERIGGECLWTGCVPSKTLIAAARAAHTMRTGHEIGLPPLLDDQSIDTGAVLDHVRSVRSQIARTDDDPRQLEDRGVDLFFGQARLGSPGEVVVQSGDGEQRLSTRRLLLCSGSHPVLPDVAGIEQAEPLTSETFFEIDELPRRLAVIGGGPIGVELAQACARLGTDVTLLQRGSHLLRADEPELTELLAQVLRSEGVDVRCEVDVLSVDRSIDRSGERGGAGASGRAVSIEVDEARSRGSRPGTETKMIEVEALLVAAGQAPNIDGLCLEEAGVDYTDEGVTVDEHQRTSVPWVFAAGDVSGGPQFTHRGAYEASIAVRNMFLPLASPVKAVTAWCTFTDPELAHTGLTVSQAHRRFGDKVRVFAQDLDVSDRARADGVAVGRMVLVEGAKKLVGAHVLAPAAGEIINELTLAIQQGLSVRELGSVVHVYPTIATSLQQAASEPWYEMAESVGWLARAGRLWPRRW